MQHALDESARSNHRKVGRRHGIRQKDPEHFNWTLGVLAAL